MLMKLIKNSEQFKEDFINARLEVIMLARIDKAEEIKEKEEKKLQMQKELEEKKLAA